MALTSSPPSSPAQLPATVCEEGPSKLLPECDSRDCSQAYPKRRHELPNERPTICASTNLAPNKQYFLPFVPGFYGCCVAGAIGLGLYFYIKKAPKKAPKKDFKKLFLTKSKDDLIFNHFFYDYKSLKEVWERIDWVVDFASKEDRNVDDFIIERRGLLYLVVTRHSCPRNKSDIKPIVHKLINHYKANINARDRNGNTPLYWATGNIGTPEAVEALLDFPNVDLWLEGWQGTCLENATRLGNVEAVRLLCNFENRQGFQIGATIISYWHRIADANISERWPKEMSVMILRFTSNKKPFYNTDTKENYMQAAEKIATWFLSRKKHDKEQLRENIKIILMIFQKAKLLVQITKNDLDDFRQQAKNALGAPSKIED